MTDPVTHGDLFTGTPEYEAMRDRALGPVYRSVVAERGGEVYTTDGALAHLLGHNADEEACEECPASVQVVTGSAMPTGGFLDERLPGTYSALDVLVEHDDLDALEVSEATERIKQCDRIADALNAAWAAPQTPGATVAPGSTDSD